MLFCCNKLDLFNKWTNGIPPERFVQSAHWTYVQQILFNRMLKCWTYVKIFCSNPPAPILLNRFCSKFIWIMMNKQNLFICSLRATIAFLAVKILDDEDSSIHNFNKWLNGKLRCAILFIVSYLSASSDCCVLWLINAKPSSSFSGSFQ